MLRQVVQGARWCQHGASKSASIPVFPRRKTFVTTLPRFIHFGGPNDKVRIFEQDTRGSKRRRKVDPEAEDRLDREEIEEKLSSLEQELQMIKEGPFSPNSPFMKSLPEKERVLALEALRKYDEEKGSENSGVELDAVFDEELDEMLRKEFEGFAKEEEEWLSGKQPEETQVPVARPSYEITSEDYDTDPYVDRFNTLMRQFVRDPSKEDLRQELWKWYRRCKQASPDFLRRIPKEAIALLWDSQALGESTKATRPAHLQALFEDATSVGHVLSTPYIFSYILALHNGGESGKALDQWESYQTVPSQNKEDLEGYWKLGVQLFAAQDNPQRAQDIALAFLANDKSRQSRVLIPVINAWGRQSGKDAEVKAWALYLQLKTFLGADMTMKDYDSLSIGLLKANRLDLALAVFKDMMVTGQDPANDSTALYKAALGLTENLQASSINEQEVNKVSLSALTLLPRRFQNRFFYASWIKKLIGMGEVDSAALVIELMYERGVRPDSKHLNGIIAAWLREGSASARDKAERLGWAMVQQRIDIVWVDGVPVDTSNPPVKPVISQSEDGVRIPKFMQRTVPPANIETFSILLLHYTRRSDDDMIKYLTKCLGDARIRPNSYFMNHLLYAELRKQDIRSLWQKFQTMSTSIRPDLETYACLWDCAKLQYDRSRTAFDAVFPSARALFSEMMHWHSQLTPRHRAVADEEFSKELYDQIIRCFCLSKDLEGTLVALHALKERFGVYPDDSTARLVVLQVARMAGVPADTPKRRLRRLSTTPRSKENIMQVNRLMELLSERRAAALQAQGLDVEHLDPAEKQQNQLGILSDLVRVIMARVTADPDRVQRKITKAAAEMSMAEMKVDLPASNIAGLL
ncbi:hypothetical protein ASPZODRAFT_152471 [Penicilliopsis zonata CBS 506.65]|uniref:Pentatricopeptide repeat protein n=1 Tax=Penicilliopsis zonata CBS 506.65 TaxID=1073090 RepID=A0A1L9SGI2_9EURO|nr:hypothetical protein ASPZODRAFT_152471 [Penicilliopsis zonata CBS 506.65]OJJ46289.1 hypothetical protein ASPZODRAFT_152471 [Penicilliopsis zonata CBS 506.65]